MLKFAQALEVPAHIELLFEEGIPVAVNGVSMGLPELTESLSTIAADHGVGIEGNARASLNTPGDFVLGSARDALTSGASAHVTGTVRMKLHLGEQTILSVSPTGSSRS